MSFPDLGKGVRFLFVFIPSWGDGLHVLLVNADQKCQPESQVVLLVYLHRRKGRFVVWWRKRHIMLRKGILCVRQ